MKRLFHLLSMDSLFYWLFFAKPMTPPEEKVPFREKATFIFIAIIVLGLALGFVYFSYINPIDLLH